MQKFVQEALGEFSYELFEGCPDPIANEDECDVYKNRLENVFFLGIPCRGGDYNAGPVTCHEASISAATEAIIRLASVFNSKYRRA